MKIEYYGHSCFKITLSSGVSILTDPFEGIGYELPENLQADILCVSHDHFDHANTAAVQAKYLIEDKGSYSVGGVKITAVERDHDEKNGELRGKNLVFVFETDELTFCHMGDIGEPASGAWLDKLPRIDLLMIPVGGNYTIDALDAVKYVEKIKPAVVIPMHYKTSDCNIDIAGVDAFLIAAELYEIDDVIGETEVKKEDITQKKIILMERKKSES